MWLLARTQSRERPSPQCLQVTGVAADLRERELVVLRLAVC